MKKIIRMESVIVELTAKDAEFLKTLCQRQKETILARIKRKRGVHTVGNARVEYEEGIKVATQLISIKDSISKAINKTKYGKEMLAKRFGRKNVNILPTKNKGL